MKRRLVHKIWGCFNALCIVLTLLSAYGGAFNPYYFYSIPAMLAMTFPFWFVLIPVLVILNWKPWRKMATLLILCMITCIVPALTFFPIGILRSNPKNKAEKESCFTLMTYNIYGCSDYKTRQFALDSDFRDIFKVNPDIICIQEGGWIGKVNYLPKTLQDSVIAAYPHRINCRSNMFFSKYEFDTVPGPELPGNSGDLSNIRLNINGHPLSIYSVHLESIGLDDDDKSLYKELTKGKIDRQDVHDARIQLISKLTRAFRVRHEQALEIRKAVDCDTTSSIIVCGDFNDISGCNAERIISGRDELFDAYMMGGFGPSITYRANRFYFHIDQILYGGQLEVEKAQVNYIGRSDHFPVSVQFFFRSQKPSFLTLPRDYHGTYR